MIKLRLTCFVILLVLLTACSDNATRTAPLPTSNPPTPEVSVAPTAAITSIASPVNPVTPTAQQGQTSPTLPVSGGQGALTAARFNMNTARSLHTATLLKTGQVLIAGGMQQNGVFLDSAEIYDPRAETFTAIGKMNAKRAGHTATLLPDGRVLLSGGGYSPTLASAEIYDPDSGKFLATGSMAQARADHTATLLANGKVLVVGGMDWTNSARLGLNSAEIYDPATGLFALTGSMQTGRSGLAAVRLSNDKVLVVGGYTGREPSTVFASAEIYDPTAGTFSVTGNMGQVRYKHAATLLSSGKVLIIGGSDNRDSAGRYATTELYDPATGLFSAAGKMAEARYKLPSATVLLGNGKILVAGGGQSAEIYNPLAGDFSPVSGTLEADRAFSAATVLANGKVLITGGYNISQNGPDGTAKAWIYQP